MKTYIGTKTVKAEPMVLGVYKKATGKDPYPGENKPYHLPGYLIEYPDGYKSCLLLMCSTWLINLPKLRWIA